MAIEPLAILSESQSRPLVVDWLVGTLVDDEAVDAAGQFEVGRRFQVAGIERVGTDDMAIGRHRLAGHKLSAIQVGYRCRLADVAFGHRCRRVGGLRAWYDGPHGRHGNVGLALCRHAVDEVESAVLVRLEIGLQTALVSNAGSIVVHALLDELADGGSPVEEELLAALSAFHDLPRQYGHPRQHVVAAPTLKLLGHARRPRLPACLVAVDEQIAHSALPHQPAGGLAVGVEIIIEEISERVAVYLRHFQPCGLARGGMVFLACERIAEAEDAPAALGKFPRQAARGIDVFGQVDDVVQADGVGSGGFGREVHHVGRRGKTCFFLSMIDFGHGEELQFGRAWRLAVEHHAEVACRGGRDEYGLA